MRRLWLFVRPILRFLEAQVTRVLQALFVGMARDVPMTSLQGPCLVIAPHADDETLGCGGTVINLRKAGVAVHVIVVTDGRLSSNSKIMGPEELIQMRRMEAQDACAVLGIEVENVQFLNFHDEETTTHMQALVDALRGPLQQLSPRLILSPYEKDLHPDHRAVARAVAILQREGTVTGQVYAYPAWFWPIVAISHFLCPWRLRGLCRVDIRASLSQKQDAMKAYRSQSNNLTGEACWRLMRPGFLKRFFKPYELFFKQDSK